MDKEIKEQKVEKEGRRVAYIICERLCLFFF